MIWKESKLSWYFNLENLKLRNKFNIIYNNKMAFYVQKSYWWLLNKKATRMLLVQNYLTFLRELKSKNNSMQNSVNFHTYKIKNTSKKTNSEYLYFFEFIVKFLKYLNPELYRRLEERNYIEKLRQEIRWIYNRMTEVDYYTAIWYGRLNKDYFLYKDKTHIAELLDSNDADLLYELLVKYESMQENIVDWLEKIFKVKNFKELNNLQFLHNFFSDGVSYFDNNSEVISLLDKISQDNELIIQFNNYILQYEKYSISSKWKYKNKILYKLFELYEKTKERYFTNNDNYQSLIPVKIKEGDIYNINDYFFKTLYFVPVYKTWTTGDIEFNMSRIEEILNKIDANFWYILNITIQPLSSIDYEVLFEAENITDPKARKDLIDIGLFRTYYTVTLKSSDYSIFNSIEKRLKELEVSDDMKIVENKDISDLFPFYRNYNYHFLTSSVNLFPAEYIENQYEDVLVNFFPKKINYEKGAIIWTNRETWTPVFFNSGDESICINRHMVIMGKSGSGKTYWTKILIKNALMFNKFIIVDHIWWTYNDPKSNFILSHGWKIISFNTKDLINPLIFDSRIQKDLSTHIEYLKTVFNSVNGEKGKALSTQEERLLSLILSNIYKRPYREPKNWIIYVNIDELIKRTEEFYQIFKKSEKTEESIVASSLIQFFKSVKTGLWGEYLMSDNVLDILKSIEENNLILIDFAEIKTANKQLFQMFAFLVFTAIYKYIAETKDKRADILHNVLEKWWLSKEFYKKNISAKMILPIYLVVDEIHEYFNFWVTGNLLRSFSKEFRNKQAWLISITQEITDFLKDENWQSVFSQAASYLIFNYELPEKDFAVIKKHLLSKDNPLGLDDSDIDFLASGGDKQGSALYIHWSLPAAKIRTLTDPDFI